MEHTELVVLSVDPDRAVGVVEDGVPPAGEHDAVNRHLFGEVVPPGAEGLLDHGQHLNDGLKAILTPKGQMLQHEREHLPVVVHELLPHDVLVPDTVLGTTRFGLCSEIPKRLFLDLREEHRADRAVRLLHDGPGHPIQQLHLPRDALDVAQQFFLEVFLRLGIDPPNDLQRHADHIVDYLHRAQVYKACQ